MLSVNMILRTTKNYTVLYSAGTHHNAFGRRGGESATMLDQNTPANDTMGYG